MAVSPLQRGPDSTSGFGWNAKRYRHGYATAQTPTMSAVCGMRITTLIFGAGGHITIVRILVAGGSLSPIW